MEALGIDIKLLLAQGINFLVFLLVFKKFLYGPFKEYMAKEKRNELEKQRLLSELQKKEESLEKKQKDILDDARAQALSMVKDAEKNADLKRKELMQKAQDDITAMKLKAQKDIENQQEKLYDEVKVHILKTSKDLATAALKDFIDEKSQKEMLDHILKQINKSKAYEN